MAVHFEPKVCEYCGYTRNFYRFENGCNGRCPESLSFDSIQEMKEHFIGEQISEKQN